MKNSVKRRGLFGLKKLISLQLVIVLLTCLTGVSAAPFQEWELGRYRLLTRPTPRPGGGLRATRLPGRGFGFRFLSGVGGMSFEGIAKPDAALGGKKITIGYDYKRPDGSRLVISVGKVNYYPEIADWMLIPITRYADSEYTAIVSLTADEDADDSGDDIVYHPNLKNTLLGLRSLQADMLLINPLEMWQFPRAKVKAEDKEISKAIVGKGEALPNEADSVRAASEIEAFMQQSKEKYRSWLITDEGVNITFSTDRSDFNISGDYYYYFWNVDYGETYRKYTAQQEAMLDEVKKLESEDKVEEAKRLYKQFRDMKAPAYGQEYLKYKESLEALLDKADALALEGKLNESKKLYDKADMLEPPLIEIRSLTEGLKS